MIEKVITRAVTYAISFAVVNAVTNAVTNATRNAVAKSLKNKLVHLGVDMDDPDYEIIEQLIDVEVVKSNQYIVSVRENIFGIFHEQFIASSKEEAVKTLGKKMFGFVNVNRKVLKKEEADFFLGIWFETVMRDFYRSKSSKLNEKINELTRINESCKNDKGSSKLLSLIKKQEDQLDRSLKKAEEYRRNTSIAFEYVEQEEENAAKLRREIDRNIKIYEGTWEQEGKKLLETTVKTQKAMRDALVNPEFICTADAVGVKGFEFSATKSNTKKEA